MYMHQNDKLLNKYNHGYEQIPTKTYFSDLVLLSETCCTYYYKRRKFPSSFPSPVVITNSAAVKMWKEIGIFSEYLSEVGILRNKICERT